MPGPAPRPESLTRRRLLVALGFGGLNVALIRAAGQDPAATSTSTRPSSELAAGTGPVLERPPALTGQEPPEVPNRVYETVIVNGRVIDPASGFDGPANVGIDGGTIVAINDSPMVSDNVIDAAGLVVAPGFIDILSGEPNGFGEWFKVADGVTTNLSMHGVNNYATAFFDNHEGQVPLHFGGAFHQHFMRGEDPTLKVRPDDSMTEAQIEAFQALAFKNLGNGFAGVCFSPEYSPGTDTAEILALTAVAKKFGHDCFFHVRYSDPDEPGTSFEAIAEVLDLARATGVGVHIEHLTSTGGTFVMAETLKMLNEASDDGLDVTACVYPYDYWATTFNSFRFVGNWQERYRISYENLQIAGTDVTLTKDTYIPAKEQNVLVVALGSIPSDEVVMALQTPWIMLGSDAILTESLNNHPRSVGTFSRLLGHYVRDLGVLSLVDALAKMTILPARRMEGMIPAMARKGRMQVGADADITIFDPETVADRATVSNPAQPSVGIDTVLVLGRAVMRAGEVDRSVLAGQALRSESAS